MTLHVHGMGHFHPENEITNAFLEELDIGTNEDWILERVGIRSRRTTMPLDYLRATKNCDMRAAAEVATHDTAEMGRLAAEHALARAGVPVEDVGLIIAGSCGTDVTTPAEACEIARRLGATALSLDVHSACTTFVAQINLLEMMRPETLPDFILLVTQDAITRSVDYSDRMAAVLFGDGAAAAVVSPRISGSAIALSPALQSDPSGADKVIVKRTRYFRQEGQAVQKYAIRKTFEQLQRLQSGWASDDRNLHFVGHQANLRVLMGACERAGIPDERHHRNVELFGNSGAPSCASVLSMQWEEFGPRDDVAVVGVGAGLTWGSFLLRFGDQA